MARHIQEEAFIGNRKYCAAAPVGMAVSAEVKLPKTAEVKFPTPKRKTGILSFSFYQSSTRLPLPYCVAEGCTVLSLGELFTIHDLKDQGLVSELSIVVLDLKSWVTFEAFVLK